MQAFSFPPPSEGAPIPRPSLSPQNIDSTPGSAGELADTAASQAPIPPPKDYRQHQLQFSLDIDTRNRSSSGSSNASTGGISNKTPLAAPFPQHVTTDSSSGSFSAVRAPAAGQADSGIGAIARYWNANPAASLHTSGSRTSSRSALSYHGSVSTAPNVTSDPPPHASPFAPQPPLSASQVSQPAYHLSPPLQSGIAQTSVSAPAQTLAFSYPACASAPPAPIFQQGHQNPSTISATQQVQTQSQGQPAPQFWPGQSQSISDPGHYGHFVTSQSANAFVGMSNDRQQLVGTSIFGSVSDSGHGSAPPFQNFSSQQSQHPAPQHTLQYVYGGSRSVLAQPHHRIGSKPSLNLGDASHVERQHDARTPTAHHFSQTALQHPQPVIIPQNSIASSFATRSLRERYVGHARNVSDAHEILQEDVGSPTSDSGEHGHGISHVSADKDKRASKRVSLFDGSESGWSVDSYSSSSHGHASAQSHEAEQTYYTGSSRFGHAAVEQQHQGSSDMMQGVEEGSGGAQLPSESQTGNGNGSGKRGKAVAQSKDQRRTSNRESSARFRERLRERQNELKRRLDFLEGRNRQLERELLTLRGPASGEALSNLSRSSGAAGEAESMVLLKPVQASRPGSATLANSSAGMSVVLEAGGRREEAGQEGAVAMLKHENMLLVKRLREAEDEIERLRQQAPPQDAWTKSTFSAQRTGTGVGSASRVPTSGSTSSHSRMTSQSSTFSRADSSAGPPSSVSQYGSHPSFSSASTGTSSGVPSMSHAAQVFHARQRSSSLASNITSASSSAHSHGMQQQHFGLLAQSKHEPMPGIPAAYLQDRSSSQQQHFHSAPIQQYQIEQPPNPATASAAAAAAGFSQLSLTPPPYASSQGGMQGFPNAPLLSAPVPTSDARFVLPQSLQNQTYVSSLHGSQLSAPRAGPEPASSAWQQINTSVSSVPPNIGGTVLQSPYEFPGQQHSPNDMSIATVDDGTYPGTMDISSTAMDISADGCQFHGQAY